MVLKSGAFKFGLLFLFIKPLRFYYLAAKIPRNSIIWLKEKTRTIIQSTLKERNAWSHIDYSMSVIVSRALPDVRDGLKRSQPAESFLNAGTLEFLS